MYLLPAIDILDGSVVRLAEGDYARATIYNDDPLKQARIFEEAGATWVHVVDLNGAKAANPVNIDVIERIARATSLKIEVGGGIRSLDTLARLFEIGVSRAVLGTALVRDREFACAAVERYGDRLAAGIDAKSDEAAVEGWREGSGISANDLVTYVSEMGYTHLIYTDIARDGMQTGIDAQTYAQIAHTFGHPVIASGGVANVTDIESLSDVSELVEGVIVGRAIYEGSLSVEQGIAACNAVTTAGDGTC